MWYLVMLDTKTIQGYGFVERKSNLSTNLPIEWFGTEEELAKQVDALMGVGWYKSQKTDLTLPD